MANREGFESQTLGATFSSEDSNGSLLWPCTTYFKNGVASLRVDRSNTGSQANVRCAFGSDNFAICAWFMFTGDFSEGNMPWVALMLGDTGYMARAYMTRSGSAYSLNLLGTTDICSTTVVATTWYGVSLLWLRNASSGGAIYDSTGAIITSGTYTATDYAIGEGAIGGADETLPGFITYYDDFQEDRSPTGLITPYLAPSSGIPINYFSC